MLQEYGCSCPWTISTRVPVGFSMDLFSTCTIARPDRDIQSKHHRTADVSVSPLERLVAHKNTLRQHVVHARSFACERPKGARGLNSMLVSRQLESCVRVVSSKIKLAFSV